MTSRALHALSSLALGAVLAVSLVACGSSGDDDRLCSYRGSGSESQAYAPCVEGEAFAESMRDQGFPDYADVYMPSVAADTCSRVASGQPLGSWSSTNLDPEVNLAYRQAEIAARCPE